MMKTDAEAMDEELHLGSAISCSKCGETSYHPFYACKMDCPLTVSNTEKDVIHYKFEPSSVRCKEIRKPCGNQKMTPSDMIDHLKSRHGMKGVTMYPEDTADDLLGVVHIALPSDKLKGDKEFRWPATTFICNGLDFCFRAVLDTTNQRESKVHFWVFVGGSERMAKTYKYRISLGSARTKKLCWARTVHSWSYYDFAKIKSRRETVPVPVKVLVPLCKKQEGKNHAKYLVLKVKIYRNKNGVPTP